MSKYCVTLRVLPMAIAITSLQKWQCWKSEFKEVTSRYRRVSDIREYYRKGGLDLRQAMEMSKGSLSTDPRDQIFALLGLAKHGPTLVPMPNYQQSLEEIL